MTHETDSPTREQIAKAEIGHTEIGAATARMLAAGFLAILVAVPAVRVIVDLRADSSRLPQPVDAFRLPAQALRAYRRADGTTTDRVLAANAATLRNIASYEAALEDGSPLGRLVRPTVQGLMVRWGGQGNEKVAVGRDGWLFHVPSLLHVTGPGFLEPVHQARRRTEGNEYTPTPQGDPLLAVIHFHQQLRARGIQLLVMPVPAKITIHPDRFSSRFEASAGPVRNPSFERFAEALRAWGVLVFDPAPLLAGARREAAPHPYLPADTHWTPAAMDLVAERLARVVAARAALGPPNAFYHRSREPTIARNIGDLARMLDLDDPSGRFGADLVGIMPVFTQGSGLRWRSQKTAEVLLLGDSFTNIYSLEAMGWGASAGLAEQLSFYLQRPVDRLVRNDAGAWATRQMLARALAGGRDRLAGKKIVIWQFAARELSLGNWKLLDMTPGRAAESRFLAPEGDAARVVTATVSGVSPVPRPRAVAYKDHICQVHLIDLHDESGRPIVGREALVFMWSMRDKTLTAAARYREGQSVTVRIAPWQGKASEQYGRINRSEFDDDEIDDPLNTPLWWGKEVSP